VSGSSGIGWGRASRLFHWLVALLVFATIAIGAAMTSVGFESVRSSLYVGHKAIGVALLLLIPLRAAWRILHPAPALPESIPQAEQRLASATHAGLYLLLFGMAVSGYLRTVGGGYPIEVLDAIGVPPLVGEFPIWADRLSVLHGFGAYLLIALIAAHISVVGYHALFGERRILSRMWPPFARGGAMQRQDEETAP